MIIAVILDRITRGMERGQEVSPTSVQARSRRRPREAPDELQEVRRRESLDPALIHDGITA